MEEEIESTSPLESETVETGPSDVIPSLAEDVSVCPCPACTKPTLSEKRFDFTFLKSNAFYAIIIGSASATLLDPDFGSRPWYFNFGKFLSLFAAGFLGVRTVDRVTDKISGM